MVISFDGSPRDPYMGLPEGICLCLDSFSPPISVTPKSAFERKTDPTEGMPGRSQGALVVGSAVLQVPHWKGFTWT